MLSGLATSEWKAAGIILAVAVVVFLVTIPSRRARLAVP
jgi:hypothetical protein